MTDAQRDINSWITILQRNYMYEVPVYFFGTFQKIVEHSFTLADAIHTFKLVDGNIIKLQFVFE
jgi:hypothetical protein